MSERPAEKSTGVGRIAAFRVIVPHRREVDMATELHIAVSGFSFVLGCAALLAAFSRIWRTDLPVLAICLLIIGASLVAKPLLTKTT
jgi:hypothetical protein